MRTVNRLQEWRLHEVGPEPSQALRPCRCAALLVALVGACARPVVGPSAVEAATAAAATAARLAPADDATRAGSAGTARTFLWTRACPVAVASAVEAAAGTAAATCAQAWAQKRVSHARDEDRFFQGDCAGGL